MACSSDQKKNTAETIDFKWIKRTIEHINNKKTTDIFYEQFQFSSYVKNQQKKIRRRKEQNICSKDFPFQLDWIEFGCLLFFLFGKCVDSFRKYFTFRWSMIDFLFPYKFGEWFLLFMCAYFFFNRLIFAYIFMMNVVCTADDNYFYFALNLCIIIMYSFSARLNETFSILTFWNQNQT